jgi:hypothetical protein
MASFIAAIALVNASALLGLLVAARYSVLLVDEHGHTLELGEWKERIIATHDERFHVFKP